MTPTPAQIREARALLGLTQDNAAELLHMARRTYQDNEAGRARMSGAAWELMCIKMLQHAAYKAVSAKMAAILEKSNKDREEATKKFMQIKVAEVTGKP